MVLRSLKCPPECCLLENRNILCQISPHVVFWNGTDDIDTDVSEDLGLIVGFLQIYYCTAKFVKTQSNWDNLIADVSNFKIFGEPPNILSHIKKYNFYGKCYITYSIVGGLIYGMARKLDEPKCRQMNTEKGINELCGYLQPTYLPFAIVPPWNHVIFVSDYIIAQLSIIPSLILYFIAWEITNYTIVKIHHLKEMFPQHIQSREKFNNWVKYHQHILKISEDLNECIYECCAQLSVTSAVIYGFLSYSLIKELSVSPLCFLIGYVIAGFIMCDTGQRLSDETVDIQNAILESNWYEIDERIKKDIIFVLMRCQKPCYLYAKPFGILNYSLFIMMIKTSYSYLTLLNNSTNI